jgi:Tol biopolymer transport system component
VTREGVQRSAGPTTLDGHTWQLDQDFFEPGDADCTPRGRSSLLALTADGKRLLFAASPASAGVGGQARIDVPWNLYLQDLPGGQPRAVARGLVSPTGLAVAPDDRGVVVRGGARGLWYLDLASCAVRPIAKGNLLDPSFSPDGRRLVALLRLDDHAELRVLDNPTGG